MLTAVPRIRDGHQGTTTYRRLLIAGAVGSTPVPRTPGLLGALAPPLLAVTGAMLVVAGAFRTDPYNGFPQGADPSPTLHGLVQRGPPRCPRSRA